MVEIAKYKFLDITVHTMTKERLYQIIRESIVNNCKVLVANHNLHSIYIYHHNSKMRSFYSQADYTMIDGMPIVFFGKLLKYPLERTNRITCLDWTSPVFQEASEKQWRIFYLGSKPKISQRGEKIIKKLFPKLQIQFHHGYFSHTENEIIIHKINSFKTDILMVGMGMPRQEHWIYDNYCKISAKITFLKGGYLDYIAGSNYTPPRWLGNYSLEWLYRLMSDPTRLVTRYLLEPCYVINLLLKELLR